jgi:squalene-hopene/tetraprenyl-beta-curcumene cyclase
VLERGVRHLIDTQRADGQWEESHATGTGFPNVFYLRYTLYRNYFPLMALTQARAVLGS